jgi:pimeloyl-ACP methyl ester carboxylesterase
MKRILCIYGLLIFVYSCKTIDDSIYEPYRKLTMLNYENNTAYEFKNIKSDKLIIYIDGTGWYSVLGWKHDDKWGALGFSNTVVNLLQNDFNILIPERLNMQLGKYYYYNPDIRRNYTLENLVKSYSLIINAYLDETEYSSILLVGYSEGAALLPLIYENIEQKNNINGIAAVSYGGLSLYEQITILGETELNIPDYYREACLNIGELRNELKLYPESIGEIMGYTYRWWNSFMDYRPFEYYAQMNIPALFIHGALDVVVPVESTRYIQENLPDKPYDYIYIEDAGHAFMTKSAKKIFEKNIVEWVKEHI